MRYRFNDFELDADKFELRQNGILVAVEPQVFALLRLLIERKEQMVSKNDIVETIWDGRIVSDSSVASRIRLARKVLGDDGVSQHTIRTIHGRGYRFIAEVAGPMESDSSRDITVAIQAGPQPANETTGTGAEPLKTTKPSIVVLPFQHLGGGTPDAIIADALPHELIQALSRLRWLFVIARGTAFRFRERDADVQMIGRTLGVRYCLSSSIEFSGPNVLILIELSDTKDGGVVWSDSILSAIDNVHEIRADIVARVVSSVETHIPLHEAQNASLGVTESLDAWAFYHLGLQHMYRFNKRDNAAATVLFERAVAQDPGFARGYAGLSFTHFQDAFVKYTDDTKASASHALRYAERSLELDPLDPFANFTMGRYFWLEGTLDNSFEWLDRALTLSPNYAQCLYSHAFTDVLSGNSKSAINYVEEATNLSPLDPLLYGMRGVRALSLVTEGNFEQAAEWSEKAVRSPGAHYLITMVAVIAHSLVGDDEKASFWADIVRRRKSDACADQFFQSFPFTDLDTRNRVSKALDRFGF